MWEESGGVIVDFQGENGKSDDESSIQQLRRRLLGGDASSSSNDSKLRVLWYAPGSFALYLWEMRERKSGGETKRLENRKQSIESKNDKAQEQDDSNPTAQTAPTNTLTSSRRSAIVSLHWVDLYALIRFLDAPNDTTTHKKLLPTKDGEQFDVPPFLAAQLNVDEMKEWMKKLVRETDAGEEMETGSNDNDAITSSSTPLSPSVRRTLAASSCQTPSPPFAARTCHTPGNGGSSGSGTSRRGDIPAIPAHMTRYPYMDSRLRSSDARGYRAAGVLAYRAATVNGRLIWQVLVGLEGPTARENMRGRLNLLGGKIKEETDRIAGEPVDYGPASTAARRMWEETGGSVAASWMDIRERLMEHMDCNKPTSSSSSSSLSPILHAQVLWYPESKYALHFLPLRGARECSVAESYSAGLLQQQSNSNSNSNEDGSSVTNPLSKAISEMDELHWVNLDEFIRYLAINKNRRPHMGKVVTAVASRSSAAAADVGGEASRLRTADGKQFPTVSFMVAMLNTQPMRAALKALMAIEPTVESETLGAVAPWKQACEASSQSRTRARTMRGVRGGVAIQQSSTLISIMEQQAFLLD